VNVDAIVFWLVWNAEESILEAADFIEAITLSAQTARGSRSAATNWRRGTFRSWMTRRRPSDARARFAPNPLRKPRTSSSDKVNLRMRTDRFQGGVLSSACPYSVPIHSRCRADQIVILFQIHSPHRKGGNDQRERSRAAAKGVVVPALCRKFPRPHHLGISLENRDFGSPSRSPKPDRITDRVRL
jgi:hypothetical protein